MAFHELTYALYYTLHRINGLGYPLPPPVVFVRKEGEVEIPLNTFAVYRNDIYVGNSDFSGLSKTKCLEANSCRYPTMMALHDLTISI